MEKETIGEFDLYCGDCRDVLPLLQLADVAAVITDPPYGIDGATGRINKARAKGDYISDFNDTPEYIKTLVADVFNRVINDCGCVIVTPGIKNMAMYPQPDSFGAFYQPAAVGLQVFGNVDAQPIFYYGKNASGKNMGKPCSYVLTEQPEKTGHPCTKPTKIWERLIANNTKEGQTILDPFMGSGTGGVACQNTGRKFIGIELERRYFDMACERITACQSQLRLL